MNKYVKALIGFIVFAILIGGSSLAYKALKSSYENQDELDEINKETDTQVEDTANEEPAPDFTVYDESGDEVTLESKRGKPVVLNFWASWCPPCKAEMPDFEKVFQELDTEVEFMMVNMTDGMRETKEKARSHIEESGYTFPVYFDTNQDAAVAYSVTSIPTTYFIDEDGNIVTYVQGLMDEKKLRSKIDMITNK